jgi:hypothetical protein
MTSNELNYSAAPAGSPDPATLGKSCRTSVTGSLDLAIHAEQLRESAL